MKSFGIQISRMLAGMLLVASAVACGGSSSSNNDPILIFNEVLFQGTVRAAVSSDSNAAIPGVSVCTSGQCGITDETGSWRLSLPVSQYSGGTMPFELNGPFVQGIVNVANLNPNATNISIDFFQRTDGEIFVTQLSQDGSSPGPDSDLPAPSNG
jgi:hypothetical protein